MIRLYCEECGAPISMSPSRFYRSKHHFCSRQCHMRNLNREMNPHRMENPDTREKVRMARLNKGECKTYQKYHGRHTHRVIAEQKIGRPLKPGEVVHHIDGNKRNNDPSNLMIFATQADHARYHAMLRKEVSG